MNTSSMGGRPAPVSSPARDVAWHGQPIVRILLGPWQQRWNMEERWSLWLLMLVPLAPAVLAYLRPATGLIVGVVLVLLVVAAIWATTAANVFEQNVPGAARLVPGHVRRLRQAIGLAAALAVVIATAMCCAGYAVLDGRPNFGWHADSWSTVVGASASVAALVAVASVLMVRWNQLGWSTFAFPVLAFWRDGLLLQVSRDWSVRVWSAAPEAASAALVVFAVIVSAALVQSGGDAHERSYAKRQAARDRFRRRAVGLEPTEPDAGGRFDLVGRTRLGAYQRWFAWTLGRTSSATARLALGLGPAGHWTTMVGKTSSMLAIAAVVLTVMAIFGPPDMPTHILNGLVFGTMFLAATPVLQTRARYAQSQQEQSLLVLLPGMPRGASLARSLALRATFEFIVGWSALCLVAYLAQAFIGASGFHVTIPASSSAIVAVAMLPMITLAWRRLDRLPRPTQAAVLGNAALMAASCGLVTLLWKFGASLPAVGIAFALLTAAWCAWRWMRMAGEPAPLPAGRQRA